MNLTMEQILDELEKVVIIQTKAFLKEILKKEVDEQMAKNVISKIGVRLAFGKDVYDMATKKKTI